MKKMNLSIYELELLLGGIYVRKKNIDALLSSFTNQLLIELYNKEKNELIILENKLLGI
jgi:hypothetical protein